MGSSTAGIDCRITVNPLRDLSGNKPLRPVSKRFTGSTTPDQTPPEVTYQSPYPGSIDINRQSGIAFSFSEGVTMASVSSGVSWSSDQGPVAFSVVATSAGLTFSLLTNEPVAGSTVHTVRLTGIKDPSGNTMADVEWSYTTRP